MIMPKKHKRMVILKLFGRISFLLKTFFFINVWGPLSQPRFIFTTMKLTNVGTTYKKKKKLFRSIKIFKKRKRNRKKELEIKCRHLHK